MNICYDKAVVQGDLSFETSNIRLSFTIFVNFIIKVKNSTAVTVVMAVLIIIVSSICQKYPGFKLQGFYYWKSKTDCKEALSEGEAN